MEYDDTGGAAVKTEPWEPPHWKDQLACIRTMRSRRDAPVDQMGAEKCFDTKAPAHVGDGFFFSVKSHVGVHSHQGWDGGLC